MFSRRLKFGFSDHIIEYLNYSSPFKETSALSTLFSCCESPQVLARAFVRCPMRLLINVGPGQLHANGQATVKRIGS